MKSLLIKIIFGFCIVVFINACHTFKHQNFFLQNSSKNSNQKSISVENKKSKVYNTKSSEKSDMAPIDTPRQTEKVQKLVLQNNVKVPSTKNFNLDKLINWSEEKLIKMLGKSHFIKEEGKLKNYQYYFKKCFLDVFLLKKNGNYSVNYVETRPTELNGKIERKDCFKEIIKILN